MSDTAPQGEAAGDNQRPSDAKRFGMVALIVIALLIPPLVLRASQTPDGASSLAAADAVRMPAEAPASAASSTWYCAMPRAAGGTYPGTISVASSWRSRVVSGSITWINESGSAVASTAVPVPPGAQVAVQDPLVAGSYVAATATFPAGLISVWANGGGARGQSVYPCQPFTSAHWYFAGADADGADQLIYLVYNPTTTAAVADLGFAGPDGTTDDPAFQGVYIPAGGLVLEDLSRRLFASGPQAVAVNCRLGRVVAFQAELRPPSPVSASAAAPAPGTGAVSIAPGAPSAGSSWFFPNGSTASANPEDVFLYNPGDNPAVVRVAVSLDAGSATPFRETVPAGSSVDLSLNGQPRIPPATGESIAVTVLTGPPIVAFQSVGTPAPPASATALQTVKNGGTDAPWLASQAGARRTATSWIIGGVLSSGAVPGKPIATSAPPGTRVVVAVLNTGNRRTTATVSWSGRDPHTLSVPAHGHALVQLDVPPPAIPAHAAPLPPGEVEVSVSAPALRVRAHSPVVAAGWWLPVGLPGWVVTMGAVGAG